MSVFYHDRPQTERPQIVSMAELLECVKNRADELDAEDMEAADENNP